MDPKAYDEVSNVKTTGYNDSNSPRIQDRPINKNYIVLRSLTRFKLPQNGSLRNTPRLCAAKRLRCVCMLQGRNKKYILIRKNRDTHESNTNTMNYEDVGNIADVSAAHTVFIFTDEVSSMNEFSYICVCI
jgi:hypothetical protein